MAAPTMKVALGWSGLGLGVRRAALRLSRGERVAAAGVLLGLHTERPAREERGATGKPRRDLERAWEAGINESNPL